MLVLTRKEDETIVINGRIVIRVLKTKGGSVRLGIEAPENFKVLRGELSPHNQLDEVRKQSSQTNG